MALNTLSKRARAASIAIIAAQLALACGGGDKLDPPVASSIAAQSTTSMEAIAGTAVSQRPSVLVKDQRGNPMPNLAVTFAAVLGGGTVTGASQTTDASGSATVGGWVLGATAGENALTASVSGLPPLTFAATGKAGPPAAIVKVGDFQSAIVGAAVPEPVSVMITDAGGNPISGAVVAFEVTSGGGSIVGESATSGADGIATLGSWTLGTTPGLNKLTVTSGALGEAVFTAIAVVGPPTRLGIHSQPSEAGVDVTLAPGPVVHVQDTYGNLVTTATTSVTAALASGAGTLGGAVTVSAVAGVATFANLVISGLTSDGTVSLRFTAPGLATATSSTFAALVSPPNLTIDGLYVIQATQTYGGTVPLVAGRPGLIRVFAKASRSNTMMPVVRVRLYRAGNLVQTYTINAPTSAVPTVIQEGSLSSSWNVAVPASVMQPGLSILADVDPSGVISEGSETDNMFPASGTPLSLDVRQASTFRVTLVPVIQSPNGLQGDVTVANKDSYMDYAWRVYPISSYDAAVRAPYTFGGNLSSSYDSTWSQLLAEMANLHLVDTARFYYGVLKPAYTSGGTGFGYIGLGAAIGVDWTTAREPGTNIRAMTAAHEWGHNFNRRHVACGGPTGIDAFYPYDPQTIGVYGYDIESGALRPPGDFKEFMSYCQPVWISDYTYKAVMDRRGTTSAGVSSSSGGSRRSLLVWGRIGPDGVVLEPSFEIDARPSLPERAGPYRIRGTDAAGREMFNFSFTGTEIDHLPNHRHFAFVVPLPTGQARPAAIRLSANGREAIRGSALTGALGNAPMPPAAARLSRIGGTRSRLEWDVRTYPMAMVRDPATGQILSFARGGRLDIGVPGQELDVTFSDGVSSNRQRIRVAPR
ncbi:MAG: Ig-like domain-containing protein [Gemmatimonadaceae bacterium]